jgi:hypothetical protein
LQIDPAITASSIAGGIRDDNHTVAKLGLGFNRARRY